ncbi:MAG: LLM class flavin-dependent oxidoreductase [Armatimonadetes bacterium]|nr:LLM class flavin-dependent oxidoreductase [Armatimonadota bacterium]
MSAPRTTFGLTLPNRGVVVGLIGAGALLELAEAAEASGKVAHVWIGDSILSKPRLEAIGLFGALAARTKTAILGVGCMATIVQRHPVLFALQWASLDVLSNGRMLLAACLGYPGSQTPAAQKELDVMGVPSKERPGRMEEMVEALRVLWASDHASFHGRYYRFEDVDLQPRPVQRPCPIWIASNPQERSIGPQGVERALRRVARLGDGWMTTLVAPDAFRQRWARVKEFAREAGRDPGMLRSALYYNLNVNPDREAAYRESKAYLDTYYTANFEKWFVDAWTAYGPLEECVAKLRGYVEAGFDMITIRLTARDQWGQLRIYLDQVLPALGVAARR